ncbi:MAG: AAA family ATPase, partial [bacterium]|nr:AAA family ATPase [bacterium]
MRFFNTAGPIIPEDHYHIDLLKRIDSEEVLMLIDQKKYFVLHAPRQTGKTSCLLALMKEINKQGKYTALYMNVEAAQTARENIEAAIGAVLYEFASRFSHLEGSDRFQSYADEVRKKKSPETAFNMMLTKWSEESEKPVVLFIDEVDTMIGDSLISLLRQIRSGYDKRPDHFPYSIILCGVRDVRDYRIHSNEPGKEVITGGSAFNIKAESLRLGDLTESEVYTLLDQHTEETGQIIEKKAKMQIWNLAKGQPWLVNALAYRVCFKEKANRDRSVIIKSEMVESAKEDIIQARDTHIYQLIEKLKEKRVQRVISPMLCGEEMEGIVSRDDRLYLVDLGLVRKGKMGFEISNPIYAEVIPRELNFLAQDNFESEIDRFWYIDDKSGLLLMEKLLTAFQEFFRENSEIWIERFDYKEAGPHLLLQAYLQRIVNGGGSISREYGLGKRRTDIFIKWPYGEGKIQKEVIELKILYNSLEKTIAHGLEQIGDYMDKCGVTEGHLLIFDRSKNKSWDEKIFRKEETYEKKKVTVWG